jgi:hypothetical protein
VHELYEELVHTDDREYRQELKSELERLERLDTRLGRAEPEPLAEQPPA